jgi:hypothetical protein
MIRLGINFEYTGKSDPVPSIAVAVTIPWFWTKRSGFMRGWGWREKVWRVYVTI